MKELAKLINSFSTHISQRRKRTLHIGLFGYSRATRGVRLPRAIPFCSSLYSLGLPPELLGLNALDSQDLDFMYENYPNFESDLKDALMFLNQDNMEFFPKIIVEQVNEAIKMLGIDFAVDEKHKKVTSIILENCRKNNFRTLEEDIIRAGPIRGFLG